MMTPTESRLRVLAIGAHPDDCDVKAGGVAVKYARQGHSVLFVSMTNGDTGHHEMGGPGLAARRRAESEASARLAGIEYRVLRIHSGELMPTLENRKLLVQLIREYRPDLLMTHRPNDYHPDHRYLSQLVQDACYQLTVPLFLPSVPHLAGMPAVVLFSDSFTRPWPFCPGVAVDIDDVAETKLDMLHCHASQMYEWLPYNRGILDAVPTGESERRQWLAEQRGMGFRDVADQCRGVLVRFYGEERGKRVQCAEAFEICEYGVPLSEPRIRVLFPFYD
jgi:N-acetylglucosamine malate deacetylase 1